MGPVACDLSWQSKEGKGFDVFSFEIDGDRQSARCPAGKSSCEWLVACNARGGSYVRVSFAALHCQACDLKASCTGSQTGRALYLHPREEHEALHTMRQKQQTVDFRQRYAARAGIEGTLSEGIRDHGMHRSRYIGQSKTPVQNLMVATAKNFCRVFEWLMQTPFAKTRLSRFARLNPALATAG